MIMLRLYVKDNTSGRVHEYGTNQHDALILQNDGSLHYENLQCCAGTMFPEEGYRSKTIGVVNRGDLDFDTFHSKLKSKGYEISNGYGEVKGSTFRIGHMGDITPSMLKELLSAMDETLEEMQ